MICLDLNVRFFAKRIKIETFQFIAGKSAGKPNFPGSVVDVNLDETVESKMSNVEDAFLKQAILIIQQT